MQDSVVHLGGGAMARIGAVLDELSSAHVLFVVDTTAYDSCGAANVLEPVLSGRTVTRFSDFTPNPDVDEIERGIRTFEAAVPDVVIGLGGGTALDLAKSIPFLAGQNATPRDLITGREPSRAAGPPVVAIPTTAGTGSEATHFAVAYVDGIKYSIAHETLLPAYALVDPRLTYNLPASVTAASGLDALCQAVESFWAVAATDLSLDYATRALRLAATHLCAAVHRPTEAARCGMSEAAHLAGRAINLGKTTAPHALSYAITTEYGVPHGLAVAVTLVPLLRYNSRVTDSNCTDPRGCAHVRRRIESLVATLKCDGVEAACARLQHLIEVVGGPVRLADIGIDSNSDIERLAHGVNLERLANNPRALSTASLRELLRSVV